MRRSYSLTLRYQSTKEDIHYYAERIKNNIVYHFEVKDPSFPTPPPAIIKVEFYYELGGN